MSFSKPNSLSKSPFRDSKLEKPTLFPPASCVQNKSTAHNSNFNKPALFPPAMQIQEKKPSNIMTPCPMGEATTLADFLLILFKLFLLLSNRPFHHCSIRASKSSAKASKLLDRSHGLIQSAYSRTDARREKAFLRTGYHESCLKQHDA